jgi:hypothetical protein
MHSSQRKHEAEAIAGVPERDKRGSDSLTGASGAPRRC